MATILQLNPQIKVKTLLGDGYAYFIMDYDLNINTIWVVRLNDGTVKHFDSNDLKIDANPMLHQPPLEK